MGADDEDVSPAGDPHMLLHGQHGLDGQHPQAEHAGLLPAPQAVCRGGDITKETLQKDMFV